MIIRVHRVGCSSFLQVLDGGVLISPRLDNPKVVVHLSKWQAIGD